ncbi:RusA family crossover junction endodeoxyribonuclease [Massilia timonae]|uniref:RusA family crossover junction endodeoxyribonuclease n=1 Tax=Massilia timonae TaxID=47229 RepID=UPI0028985DAA|nr:RusA family crossover junction endodeoxyribonuclease [Massilia timonae]
MITLTLPYPISANRYWQTRVMNAKSAGGRAMATTYISADAKAYKKQVQLLAHAAGVCAPIEGRYEMHIQLYPNRPQDWKTRQRKLGAAWDDGVMCIDLGNAEKVLSDALRDIVITDDKWARRIVSERMEPDGEARVVVTIAAIPVVQPQGDLLGVAQVREAA